MFGRLDERRKKQGRCQARSHTLPDGILRGYSSEPHYHPHPEGGILQSRVHPFPRLTRRILPRPGPEPSGRTDHRPCSYQGRGDNYLSRANPTVGKTDGTGLLTSMGRGLICRIIEKGYIEKGYARRCPHRYTGRGTQTAQRIGDSYQEEENYEAQV